MGEKFLARHTTATLFTLLGGKKPVVALVPIGSTEPHGPHLGLGTDVVISAAACVRACEVLDKKGPLTAVIAPAVSYGVTDCAVGFPGAVTIPPDVLTAYVAAICDGLLAQGLRHVCLVNNHLEPAHDAAIRAVLTGREGKVSYACPLTRKWARTLSAEFKSGACHAGQYETSIVMAAAPELVDEPIRQTLAAVPVSLSEKLAAGITTFTAMGMELAYAGAPAQATVEEGEQLIQRLAEMVVGEVREALGLPA
jgi:creatinine amidohydrolase